MRVDEGGVAQQGQSIGCDRVYVCLEGKMKPSIL